MKYILTSALLICCMIHMQSQTIKDVVRTMPDNIILGLTADQKEELVSGTVSDTVTTDNALNGEIRRVCMSDDYINIETSDAGTTQIKLLPLINDSKILCVVKTVCANACDSRIRFYSTDWKLLPQQNLIPQRTFDWFLSPETDKNSADYKEAMKVVDMNPMLITLSPNNYSMEVDSDIANYLNTEDYTALAPFLDNDPQVFVWDKISFKTKE